MGEGIALVAIMVLVVICVLLRAHTRKTNGIYSYTGTLREDAQIVSVKTFVRGTKDPVYVTRVKFDDGFVFDSSCCEVKRYPLYNKLELSPDLRRSIVNSARLAHAKAMGLSTKNLEYELSSYKYKCGKCGYPGPYENCCPSCGSTFKVSDR